MTNSNTLIKLIEDIYQQNMGYDFTFLRELDIPCTEVPSLLHMYDVYKRDKKGTVDAFIEYRGLEDLSGDCVLQLKANLCRILHFYDMTESGSSQNDFIHL